MLQLATRIGTLYRAFQKVDFDETAWRYSCFGINRCTNHVVWNNKALPTRKRVSIVVSNAMEFAVFHACGA